MSEMFACTRELKCYQEKVTQIDGGVMEDHDLSSAKISQITA